MATPPIRVVLADDAYITREALKHLLSGMESLVVVGEGAEPLAVPGVLDEERLGVVVLSTCDDVAYALKLFEHGCDSRAYLLKDRLQARIQLDRTRAERQQMPAQPVLQPWPAPAPGCRGDRQQPDLPRLLV